MRRVRIIATIGSVAVLAAAVVVLGPRLGPRPSSAKEAPAAGVAGTTPPARVQLASTLEDFFAPGSQPGDLFDNVLPSVACVFCHDVADDGNPDADVGPYGTWVTSMMAQSTRDPIWQAAYAIAQQDAAHAGETCLRCHAPIAWLNGRSDVASLDELDAMDFDGVSCMFCHRLVDPVADPANPPEDAGILEDLALAGLRPEHPGNAQYVVDPFDARRGPRDDVPQNLHGVPILVSPFHRESALCGTCHDVSNPIYTRQPDGTYAINALGAPHPTGDPAAMFPEQRTYSEWAASAFAAGGVRFEDRRFGGAHPTGVMSSCQDCHMPDEHGGVCVFWESAPFAARPDAARHTFHGANTWVLAAVHARHPQAVSGLTRESVDAAIARNLDMLARASDLRLEERDGALLVRVVNESGHKLPTGYPEGRRMWVNARFLDDDDAIVAEHGRYDHETATLHGDDTTVFEMKAGLDETVAARTGVPAGESFHLVLNNVVLKDNRIPPRGFTNEAFAAFGGQPVGTGYEDGQHWHDTTFAIPAGATRALVTVFYQTTAREYVEFLRDENRTNGAGEEAMKLWLEHGRSAPAVMDAAEIVLGRRPGDLDGDGSVGVADLVAMLTAWGPCPAPPALCPADLDGDGAVGILDVLDLLAAWGG